MPMTNPIKPLSTDAAKFAPIGDYWGEYGWTVTASGKGVEIRGVMWPLSQLRLGAETPYGVEIFAAKWLLRERGIAEAGKTSAAYSRLASIANQTKRGLFGSKS